MSEEVWKENPFGLRIAILGTDKPIDGAPIGGNSQNVVNPRNTYREEDIQQKSTGKWTFGNFEWRNEV